MNPSGSGQIDLSYAVENNFKVFVEKLPTVTFFTTESAIPEVSAAGANVETPMQDYILQDNKLVWAPLEISFIIDEGFFAYEEVYNWMYNTTNPNATENSQLKFSDAVIMALDGSKNPVINFKFVDCFPTALSAVKYVNYGEAQRLGASVTLRYTEFLLERVQDLSPPIPAAPPPIFLARA